MNCLKPIAIAAGVALSLLTTTVVAQAPVARSHPLLGKWQWTRAANQCTEVYDFRADGTAQVLSGTEKTGNVYTITPQPDAAGFYLLTMKTVKDQGGKDCSDDTRDSVGQSNTRYVMFEPSKDRHMVCATASPERCIGPLRRVKPAPTK